MKEKKMYREENRHGSPLFPIEYYNCVYPARLPGLPVHWHEEFEITCVRRGQGTYLIDLRVKYAVRELINTDREIGDIAMDHGFPDGRAFAKAFKKRYGCLPSVYRKNLAGQGIQSK